jgi:hypothetical protein
VTERKGMNSANPSVQARLHLVEANRAAIYVAFCRAVIGGLPAGDAVVVIADTSDATSRELAQAASVLCGLNLHDETDRVQHRGDFPTAIAVVQIDAAKRLFAVGHSNVANGLDRQPLPGCVRVVSIAAGAAMLVHTDVRPSAPIASA